MTEQQLSPASPSSSPADLSFEQTVPRALAHRAALGEVFVADSLQAGDDEYLVAVQVPRAHSVWFDRRAPYHDPLATAEAVRQGSFVVVHRHVGVPRGLAFSLQSFAFHVHDLGAYRDNETSPLEGILRLRVAKKDRRRTGVGSISFEGKLAIDDVPAMTTAAYIMFLPQTVYESFRNDQHLREDSGRPPPPARPIDPALVGRFDRRNVVIGEPTASASNDGETLYGLVVDQTHPSFFDHPYDHLPGPLIAEAFRQAAIVTANREGALSTPVVAMTGCEASFSAFAELDAPAECSVAVREVSGDGRVTVAAGLHQFGTQIADGSVELTPYP